MRTWDEDWNESLPPAEASEEAHMPLGSCDVLAAAKELGTSAATLVAGNGRDRPGIGALALDWASSVAQLLAASAAAERIEVLRAHGTLAQVKAYGDPMRAAGVVDAAVQMLCDPDEMVTVAAAEAIRHLACANNQNRIAAREAGAIPHLVRMLTKVADADCAHELAAALVTAAVAALRNLSFQNGENRDLIRFSGGLAPLLRIVASGQPPAPPARTDPRREAAYRAAGALENLAADNEENASTIVEAGVVPAMKELLIGIGNVKLSQRAARKGREALFHLLRLDKAHTTECRRAAEARGAAAAAAVAVAKARVLIELKRSRGDACAAHGDAAAHGNAVERCVGLHMAQSELSALASDAWAHAVIALAQHGLGCHPGAAAERDVEVDPPAPLHVADKAARSAIYQVLRRAPLCEALVCDMDASNHIRVSGRGAESTTCTDGAPTGHSVAGTTRAQHAEAVASISRLVLQQAPTEAVVAVAAALLGGGTDDDGDGSSTALQALLVHELIGSERWLRLAPLYRQRVTKRLLGLLSGGEVLPELLEAYLDCQVATAGAGGWSERTYFVRGAPLTLRVGSGIGGGLETGGLVWDAALALSAFLLQLPEAAPELGRRRVLELGAGPGLPGLVLGSLDGGAVTVQLTDVIPATLDNLRHNVSQLPRSTAVSVEELDWHAPVETTRARYADVDLVLAADVVYEPALALPLLATIGAVLEGKPDARALLAAERRGGAWETFLRVLSECGSLRSVERSLEARAALRDAACPFWVAPEAVERIVLLELGWVAEGAQP